MSGSVAKADTDDLFEVEGKELRWTFHISASPDNSSVSSDGTPLITWSEEPWKYTNPGLINWETFPGEISPQDGALDLINQDGFLLRSNWRCYDCWGQRNLYPDDIKLSCEER